MDKKVVLLVKNGFEEAECIMVLDFLRRMEVPVKLVSCEKTRELKAYFGLQVQADLLFSEIEKDDFDMVILVGGPSNTTALQADKHVVAFVERHDKAGKFIAAECSAPAKVLGRNGLLKGRKYVSSLGKQDDIQGCFIDEGIVVDGNLISCKGLGYSMEFAAHIAMLLGCDKEAVRSQHEHIYCDNTKLKF